MIPYGPVIGAAVWIATVVGAYAFGVHNEHNSIDASQKAALEQTIQQERDNAKIDYGVQQELALEKQKHDLLAQQKSRRVAKTIAADPHATDCKLSDDSLRVLNDSIATSNGASAAASASDGAVPASDARAGLDPIGHLIRAR